MNSRTKFFCLILGLCNSSAYLSPGTKIDPEVIIQWSQLEFDYVSEYERRADIASGTFVPGIPAPIDVDVHYPSK
ncbi:hypothetical protein JTB14_010947 [Gonioctena quinquepunctata]|nr:hypothetical protein JTB14_010947 [Gonioctena quinquepunctata]